MPGVKHPRGTQVKLELIAWDELDLTVQARVLEVSTVSETISDEMDDESEPGVQAMRSDATDNSEESAPMEAAAPHTSTPSDPE